VGLPLSIALALRGKRVAVFDIDHESLGKVGRGEMPFIEEGGEDALSEALASGRLSLGSNPEAIGDSDAVVLVVATPIDGHMSPSFQQIDDILKSYRRFLRHGQLFILRSTLFPGTSARVNRWLSDEGLKIDLAVCPERISQGHGLREILSLPQIVASFSKAGLARARELFGVLTEDLVEMQPAEAELAKLFTNAWRYIKFAVANQYYMIASELGLNFDVIYDGIIHNYPRASDLPGPGFAAGPCLFKDTMQLAAFTKNSFLLGHAAMLINEGLPQYLVNSLRTLRPDLADLTVGILGMAFKAEVDDGRDSLSYKLKSLLGLVAKVVLCADPYVKEHGLVPTEILLEKSDVIIIGAPHELYKLLDFRGKLVVDIWNLRGCGRQP